MNAGIVTDSKDQTAVNAHVGLRHHGIGGDIQAHVFHHGQGADTLEASADGHVHGDLFVGRPFRVYIRGIIFGQAFQDFRAGGAGIGRGNLHAGLPCAPRDRLVARHWMRLVLRPIAELYRFRFIHIAVPVFFGLMLSGSHAFLVPFKLNGPPPDWAMGQAAAIMLQCSVNSVDLGQASR